MRIRELLTELKLDDARTLSRTVWQKKDAVEHWLHQHNYKCIGRGGLGSVWTDHEKSVVKVFLDDACYAAFVDLCRKNRGDPHLPRVSKVYPLGKDGGVVFMERLTPSGRDYLFADELQDYMRSIMNGEMDSERTREFREEYPSLAKTLDKIAQTFIGSSCEPDFTEFNFMMRGSTIVITDPVRRPFFYAN
jgi:hypothetical protein